jgi:hypothetical protein
MKNLIVLLVLTILFVGTGALLLGSTPGAAWLLIGVGILIGLVTAGVASRQP